MKKRLNPSKEFETLYIVYEAKIYEHKVIEWSYLGEIGKNCLIGHHKKIKPETLKYIGD